jgi:hypothetical protein
MEVVGNNKIEYAMMASSPDPETFEEAAHGPNRDMWILVMQEELERMWIDRTWKLVQPPTSTNIVGSK